MRQLRVTKYDPAFRNENGAYTRNEWTSLADLGRQFDGRLFTLDQYLEIEDGYVSTAMGLLKRAGIESLTVSGLESHSATDNVPKEGDVLHGLVLARAIRSVLREEFWCRLVGPSTFIHFGYDYYMYVGVPSSCEINATEALVLGIFVEDFASPH